jgi:hypothetical protein
MGDYADWAVEDSIWGSPLGDYVHTNYQRPTTDQTLQKIASFVGKAKDNDLKKLVGDFAKAQGFDESLCKSKNITRAKYNFVWNRRKNFKKSICK